MPYLKSHKIFKRCINFEQLRAAALKAVGGDMDRFEQTFILDPEEPVEVDGEWPPLSAYTEDNWDDPPNRYPVVVYGSYEEDYDRGVGTVGIITWDWIYEDEL